MIGKIINGKYEIRQALAESHMYEVYAALEAETGMTVAVKLLRGEMAENQERVKAFSDEIRLIAGLSHPSLVSVLDFDLYEGRPFAVTEFTEGTNLRDCMYGEKPMSFFDSCRSVQQLAVLLQHAYDQKLPVRAIKLSNIIRTNTGLIKVLSFSMPRLKLVGANTDETAGTQSDLFFLGTALFEMLTAESPIRKRGGINEIWDDKLRQALRIRHAQLAPEQIDMVVDFIERTLTREVKNRFSDHAAFLVGLTDLMHVSGESERLERDQKRRKLATASEIVDAINGRSSSGLAAAASINAAAVASGAIAASAQNGGQAKIIPLKPAQSGAASAGCSGGFAGSAALAVAPEVAASPASTLCPAEEMQLKGDVGAAAKPVLRLLNGGRSENAARPLGQLWQSVEEQPWVRHPYAAIGIGSFLLAVFVLLLIFW
ncbi:MAG TPA: protein kinase [Candidatus Ozemobacteraceae bacterium]|nr:protein kinase [Candidatus Ozemobacteraceae bacterium]